jgi:RNA polymerase primary sigma factor
LSKVRAATEQLLQGLGRDPLDEELAAELHLTAGELNELVRGAMAPVSLETPVGEDKTELLGDLLPDQSAISPEAAAVEEALRKETSDAFETVLTNRERLVLNLRFGLEGTVPHALPALATNSS